MRLAWITDPHLNFVSPAGAGVCWHEGQAAVYGAPALQPMVAL